VRGAINCMPARLLSFWVSAEKILTLSLSLVRTAPPAFLDGLPTYTGCMAEAENFSVTCRVECSPLCSLTWLKDGVQVREESL